MPRKSASKTSAKTSAKTSVQTSVQTSVNTATKKQTPQPVETPVTPPEPVGAETKSHDENSPHELIEKQFQVLTAKLLELRSMENSLMSDLKHLHKITLKHIKTMNKKKKRVVGEKKNRTPSGFAKPTKMSQELCKFLNKPEGTEMARTDVTKFITNYVKENNLQNPDNRREIKCDTKLKNLLNVDDHVPVTYFNLQKYMKVHFMKTEPAVVV